MRLICKTLWKRYCEFPLTDIFMEQYWNKYYITTTREYWSLLLQVWWLLKEPLVISISLFQAYISRRSTFFVNRSLKQFMVAFLEQKNVSQYGISIPPQSCLQWRQRPVTSRVIACVQTSPISFVARGKGNRRRLHAGNKGN